MSSSSNSEEEVEEVLAPVEIESSGEDPPMSEWSSLIIELPEENKKKALNAQGLYSPGSGEVCGKFIAMSDSDVFRHLYYDYPSVLDPGIEEALLSPEKPVVYADDGQDMYIALCKEMSTSVIRKFHTGLVTDEINLSYYGINPNALRAMSVALQYNKSVTRLNLTDNFLNDDACYHLGQMLVTNSTLKELILEGCRIGPSGFMRLANTLPVNRRLEYLNVARNRLGEESGEFLAKQIGEGAIVPRMNLSNNQLGRMTSLGLAEVLEYRNKMTHLDLSWNNFFHAPSFSKMLDQLAFSNVLVELNLAWNSLEGDKIAGSIKAILSVPALKILKLNNNRLKDTAVSTIVSSLIKAKKLAFLDLSYNPLSMDDAYGVLEKMLKPRVKLETLHLDGIPVNKKFLVILERVKNMKCRLNFTVTYGKVVGDWTLQGPDSRKLIFERANYLGIRDKKRRVDIGLFFLQLGKEYPRPIPVKTLIDRMSLDKVPLDDDLVNELAVLFPGPKSAKAKLIDIQGLVDYVRRMWPDKRLPPTPPPEPEPELLPPPPPPPKGKEKKKK